MIREQNKYEMDEIMGDKLKQFEEDLAEIRAINNQEGHKISIETKQTANNY